MSVRILLFIVHLYFLSFTLASDHHSKDYKTAEKLKQEPGLSSTLEHGGIVLAQKIEGKEIFDGNMAEIQSHNYNSNQGVFLQTQYNGDVMNLVIAEKNPTEPPSTTMELTTSTENMTTTTMESTSEITTMTTEMKSMFTETTTESSTTEMKSMFTETTTESPKTVKAREEPRGIDAKVSGSGRPTNSLTSENQARDYLHIGEKKSEKSIIQQHFYDGRSGILLQNQYNGNFVGATQKENFPAPLVLLMSLLQGGFNPFRGKDETKAKPTGHHIPSGTDAKVEEHDRNSVMKAPMTVGSAHSPSTFALSPFLAYIRDMVSTKHQRDNKTPVGRPENVDTNTDSSMSTIFKDGTKNVNKAGSFMEHMMMNMLGLKNSDMNFLPFNDAPIDDANATDNSGDEMITTSTEPSMNETITKDGDDTTTPMIEVDTFPANIRVNAFNVASGGQAYQIILENPDIKINIMEPEDDDNEERKMALPKTKTMEFPVPWNFFDRKNKDN
jgi:hypothetical protein